MGAEVGVMWPQAKGLVGPPEPGRDEEGHALEPSEGGDPADTWILDSQPPGLRESISAILNHPVFGHLLWQHLDTNSLTGPGKWAALPILGGRRGRGLRGLMEAEGNTRCWGSDHQPVREDEGL